MQGVDLPDIELIIQWRATCDMCTLWQRFSCAARDLKLTAKALFLVEPKHFDEVRAAKAACQEEKKHKAAEHTEKLPENQRPTKRAHIHASCDVRLAQWFEEAEVGEHIPGGEVTGGEDEAAVDESAPRASASHDTEQLNGVMDMVIDENHVLAMREGQEGNGNDIYAEHCAMYEKVP
jgi:hypothetical protein